MKILFIAFADSIHTTRWINQIIDQDHELYLFPNQNRQQLSNALKTNVRIVNANICSYLKYYATKAVNRIMYKNEYIEKNIHLYNIFRAKQIYQFIQKEKPDIIHSLEIQNSSYLTLFVKQKYYQNKPFPKWIVTNWGSDIYLFARLSNQNPTSLSRM